jgi:hypothetical protein
MEQDFAVSIQEVILVKSGVAYYLSMFADLSTTATDGVTFEAMYRSWKPH